MNWTCIRLMAPLLLISGCAKQPYEQFQRQASTKRYSEKKKIITTIRKKHLNKQIKDMTRAEALEAKQYYEDLGRYDMSLKFLPRLMVLAQEAQEKASLQLEYAHLLLGFGELDLAHKEYSKFIEANLNHPQIKQARYHQMMTLYWQLPPADRDQTMTHDIIKYADTYLEDFPQDIEFRDKVRAVLRTAYLLLLEREIGIAHSYLHEYTVLGKKTALDAVRLRLRYIREKLIPALPDPSLQNAIPVQEELEQADAISLEKILCILESVAKPPQTSHPRDSF